MTFQQAWAYTSQIPGWYTQAEARLLWECAMATRGVGACLEIGSYRGRTATLLAQASIPYGLHLCDPFILAPGSPNDTPESEGRYVSFEYRDNIAQDFVRNMARFKYTLWKCSSDDIALSDLPERIGLLHMDGDHVEGVCRDLRFLGRLEPSGIVVFHDYELTHTKFSRVKEVVNELVADGAWRVIGKADSSIAIMPA